MAQTSVGAQALAPRSGGRAKFLIGGLLIIGAIIYLIVTSLSSTAQFFLTVDEIRARGSSVVGQNLRASGAVLGETISYDPQTLTIRFEMAHVPAESLEIQSEGGLAQALHIAATNPNANRLTVEYVGPMPDLLRDEAQAIVTGRLGEDGIFYADGLLLKCPTRYEDALPEQAGN